MTVLKSYKYKIRRPSKAVVAKFEQTLNLCRELYNAALQERRDAWRLNRLSISYFDQSKQVTELKLIRQDLATVHSQVLRDTLRRVDKSFSFFFKGIEKGHKAGYPRFKSENRFDSFCYPQSGFKLDDDKLSLSKIGTVRIRLSREITGKIKNCTIKREIDGWYVIFNCETETLTINKTGKAVGIDVGLSAFAKFSNGEEIPNPKFHQASKVKLKRIHKKVSRGLKKSSCRRKAVNGLKKIYLKIKRQRLDFLHKESLKIIRNYDYIAVEDLQINNLLKNHHLANAIADASWGMFLQILEYKAENAGKRVHRTNPRYTSQNCSNCDALVSKSLSVRVHHCSNCGIKIDRDVNAAKNILNRAVGQTVGTLTNLNRECVVSESIIHNY